MLYDVFFPLIAGENELLPECEAIEFVPRGFAKASEKSKRAIHAARMFKPKSPSFMVMLRRYNFYNHFLVCHA
jgi:hypothetical protein